MSKLPGYFRYTTILLFLVGLFGLWIYQGISNTVLHVDLARDLNFLSDLWVHRIVWLGPMTSANFPASPIYYYLLFPGLLLSGGNGLSLIFSQAFFAVLALGWWAYLQSKTSLVSALLIILVIGLSPWWITASSIPWNGYMYVSWTFLALTSLWFKKPLFVSALLLGIAIAIDPAAVLALPILFFEWLTNAQRIRNFVYLMLGLLIPWTPILLFEIITQGFLTRHWLQYPAAAGIFFAPDSKNLDPLFNSLRIAQPTALILLIVAFLLGSKRAKSWIIVICLPVIFLILVAPLRQYYVLGLVCALAFVVFVTLSSQTVGKIILFLFILSYLQGINLIPLSLTGRTIPRLNQVVEKFIQTNHLDKTKKYAVVSVRDRQNSTPQADDYRFFLRVQGIKAVSIDDYPQADLLLLFVEVPNFDWQNFEDWHTQRFGHKKLLAHQNIDGIEIIIYGRKL